jgi:nucleoside-diphosphate-sugar epimerase
MLNLSDNNSRDSESPSSLHNTNNTGGNQLVLLTGASGRIGKVVLNDLINSGFRVRVIASRKANHQSYESRNVELVQFDFQNDKNFDELVEGCSAVVHLAVEMADPALMWKSNVEATARLVDAAENKGIKSFCYVSTIAVYGSRRSTLCTEDEQVLPAYRDAPEKYLAVYQTRTYARTKLAGEYAVLGRAHLVSYIILRPAVVVSVDQLIEIRTWPLIKRMTVAHRHAHHVYVGDVSAAIVWSLNRTLINGAVPGSVEIYNISEDEYSEPKHIDFMNKAYLASGDKRFRIIALPSVLDWLRDILRFRQNLLLRPVWRLTFPNTKIKMAGFQLPFGMAWAHNAAIQKIKKIDVSSSD